MPTTTFQLAKIATPDPLRAKIYEQALRDAHTDFTTWASSSPAFSSRCKSALLDRTLLDTLASIADEYVLCGVGADLARCRASLYGPVPAPVPPASAVNIDPYVAPTLAMNEPSDTDKKRGDKAIADAYKRYFDWFILPAAVLQQTVQMTGIAAFRQRHPMIAHAVDQVSAHFRANIQLACTRILADWDLIVSIFFPGNAPKELVKISSTGSDFHKGGKHVLLLTFKMRDNSQKMLVYKPSDIEADYRLLGLTAPVLSNATLVSQLGNQHSLSEELNTYLNDDFKLPTYRILPLNPGSGLAPNLAGALPIGTSYGYIEFLTNEPAAQPDGSPNGWKPKQASDWVTANPKDIIRFYRQMGRLCALACLFSVSDIHVDNLLVHALQPHLIDAEISFTGPISSIASTIILNNPSGALIAIESPSPRRGRYNDLTANLIVNSMTPMITRAPSHNRIYFAKDGKNPARAPSRDNANHIISGFLEMLTAMRKNQAQLLNWLNDPHTQNLVTRFTPAATPFFQQQLRLLYSPQLCSQPVPLTSPGYNRLPFTDWQKEAQDKYSSTVPSLAWPSPRPNYALPSQGNNFADYLNCDIPAYYHRVSSADLLNSRGEVIAVQPSPAILPINRATYFPDTTLSIVRQQVNNLKDRDVLIPWVDESIRNLSEVLGTSASSISGLWQKFIFQTV